MSTKKVFKIAASQIKTYVKGLGGCIATDEITVRGKRVAYMVRSAPVAEEDSGWLFTAGTESRAYMSEPSNLAVYDVNTIANYDPDIIPLLGAPVGSSFERRRNRGPLVPCEGTEVPDPDAGKRWPPPGFPIVEGEHAVSASWSLVLPERFARRTEEGSLVLWRPGITLWISAWSNDRGESRAARLAHFKEVASPERRDVREAERDGLTRWSYRLTEGEVETLTLLALSDTGHLQIGFYFDHEGDLAMVAKIADSVRLANR